MFDQAEAVVASVSKLKRINERRLLKGLSNKNASREIINTTVLQPFQLKRPLQCIAGKME